MCIQQEGLKITFEHGYKSSIIMKIAFSRSRTCNEATNARTYIPRECQLAKLSRVK